MGLRSRMLAGLASQLGRPTGLRGRVIGNMLNRSNRGEIAMAIAALEIPSGAVAADLGFGGGGGLGPRSPPPTPQRVFRAPIPPPHSPRLDRESTHLTSHHPLNSL